MASDPKGSPQLDPVSAREGSTRPKLVYVLAIGLALVIAAFVVASFVH